MADTPLRRYFRLPEDVKTVDFVHQIDRRASPERTAAVLGDYVVTPSVGRNLEAALDNVRRGLSAKRSVFTWIHGSFGSGKSHFMDVLSLLLADEKAVYAAHAELQAHRAKFHPEVIGRRLFRLHVQCISRGATTLEEIVFGAAVEELARLHPEAPAPAVFEVQRVFESARRLLADLGEAKFFAAFPSNREGASPQPLGPGCGRAPAMTRGGIWAGSSGTAPGSRRRRRRRSRTRGASSPASWRRRPGSKAWRRARGS